MNFEAAFRPSERCLRILMKSSRKPTRPRPVISAEHQQAAGGRAGAGLADDEQVRDAVADERGADDHRAAHGGRAALGGVAARAVLADLLAVAAAAEQPHDRRACTAG